MAMTALDNRQTETGTIRALAVAAFLFAIWGLALWLYNSLFFKFCRFFGMAPVPVSWTLASFHFAYAALAVPAALFHRQFGFKLGLLSGMSVFGVGAFLLYLAIIENSVLYFVSAAVVIGACGTWIEIALNSLAVAAGSPQHIVRRLNLAHACYGIGLLAACTIGVSLLGKDYVLAGGASAQLSARPYVLVGFGAIFLAFLLEQVALPAFAAKGTRKAPRRTDLYRELAGLFGSDDFRRTAAALFAYGAVLTVLWTASYRYLHVELPGHTAAIVERGWFWFVAGRLTANAAMRWIDPRRLLAVSLVGTIGAIAISAGTGGWTGWVALMAASFFLATAYPTVLGIGLKHHLSQLSLAAGLLVAAAGLGNALSSLASSFALDGLLLSPRLVVLAALPFAAVILVFAVMAGGKTAPEDATHATA
jgi:FHS family L-fucose permease-like MFS transporter